MMTNNRKLYNFMFIFLFIPCVMYQPTMTSNVTYKVGVLLMTNSTFPVDLPHVGPAIDKGVQDVQSIYGIKFEPIFANYSVWCDIARYTAQGYLADMFYKDNVRAFVGPACSYAVETTGRMAEYLRVPLVTGLGDLVTRKPFENDMFKTTVILSYNSRKLSVSVRALLQMYNWYHVSVIYDNDEIFYRVAGPSMVEDFERDPAFPEPYPVPFERFKDWNPRQTLQDASNHARVFIMLVNAEQFRVLMYHAASLGMADGDYVFLVIQLAEIDWWGSYRNYLKGDMMDETLKRSYESVLILSLINPVSNNTEFQMDIKQRALSDYGYTFRQDEPVHYFITAFYEAVLYLGAAYNMTLTDGGNISDGYQLARTFFNSSFDGLNQTVAVDETGTRIADFAVLDLVDPDTETFERVGSFLGYSREYVPLPNKEIRWLKGVPIDMPKCGFRGERCVVERLSGEAIAGIVGGSLILLLVMIIILQIVYSRRKANSDMRWKVSWKDVELVKTFGSVLSGCNKSKLTVDDVENSRMDMNQRVFNGNGRIGLYKGDRVYVRKYQIASIEMSTRNVQEMRKMHHLRHNNIETFIGACMEPGNIAVLSEVCPRGSLMDIIDNEGIQLDWAFRHSLINDIVQGMRYLHNSDVKVHGRLRSSSCVVDSRFMLKIKGFGPKCFIQAEEKNMKSSANISKLLWTAPEILRQSTWSPGTQKGDVYSFGIILQEIIVRGCPFESADLDTDELLWTAPEILRQSTWSPGTQKGDVYSFGIILQEIIVRGCPFESADLDTDEILSRVRRKEHPPFRPQVTSEHCTSGLLDIMAMCWDEDPGCRPTFETTEQNIKKITKTRGSNIMDNLMQRMEQYANNLESLVEERTKAYMDEKKKAEDLLYRMLPISVAKQLEAGTPVRPETYDGVTIYFSDIVGFTTLAGRSTPMQVVDLLNDLYTIFDAIIDDFVVYKVETIGDAYMCASGLPIRIGDRHVIEITNMALAIRESVRNFKIRHIPDESLRIRIGLHSGAVVAGVVGSTMPRYCLFGDTVNTASRMESNGEAMKIHISENSMQLLEKVGDYNMEYRGEIAIKGKGQMKTYWLIDRKMKNKSAKKMMSKQGNYESQINLLDNAHPTFNMHLPDLNV